MVRLILLSIMIVILIGTLGIDVSAGAVENKQQQTGRDASLKLTNEPLFQILNINNIWWWLKFNGESAHSRNDDSGIYYPRGMIWCIYKDGIKWSGRAYMDEAYTQPASSKGYASAGTITTLD